MFDFAADQRNEPRYNPRMARAKKVTDGPVGKGTVFRSAVQAIGRPTEMRSQLTGYRRPAWLASRTTMAQADIAGTLTFDPVPGGTRMRWAWVVRPKGASRLLTPLISRIGRVRMGDLDRHEAVPGSPAAAGRTTYGTGTGRPEPGLPWRHGSESNTARARGS